MADDPLELVSKTAQDCIQRVPTIVLGSGASVPHGIRGVGPLAEFLREHIEPDDEEETDAWTLIRTALANGNGLEEALQAHAAPASLVEKIVALTWKAIATDDLLLLRRVASGAEDLPLAQLVHGLFQSTATTLQIVTPNYDRVAEYACDYADIIHLNGFVPGLIRRREGNDTVLVRRGNYPARTVRIWKVHGSLDWFEARDGTLLALPLSNDIPDGFRPLVVTPGVSKYERTHDEPFRSALQGADSALDSAPAFFCVGYGFRDSHIEPRLKERCQRHNVPIVILARTLTDEAKRFLTAGAGNAYLALEHCDAGTRIYAPQIGEGTVIAGRNLWSFDEFISLVL